VSLSWPLLRSEDLAAPDVEDVLALAAAHRAGTAVPGDLGGRVVGLLFHEPSLRTRVGFAAAAHRLGARAVEVLGARDGPTTSPERWEDAVRVLAGYTSVVVARPGAELDPSRLPELCPGPFINAGGTGPAAQHPTQALVDLFAMRTLARRPPPWHVVVIGDPTMRAARSLLRLLPIAGDARSVTVVSHPSLLGDDDGPVHGCTPVASVPWDDVDVVYAAGMAHESLPLAHRDELIVGPAILGQVAPDALVLSPMPVIDEIAPEVRTDPRVRFFEQSDLGLFVRMALLHRALERT
jgi:aspartate carbamoyltransferase catalytic subunit